jgi:hypothetical protein
LRGSRDARIISFGFRSFFSSLVCFLVPFDIFVSWYPYDFDGHSTSVGESLDLGERRNEDLLTRLLARFVDAFDCCLAVGENDAFRID